MMTQFAKRTSSRRIDLLAGNDFHCALLGSMGYSTKYIMDRTDLTPSQIGYRLRCAGIKRSDYRNGESPLSKAILAKSRAFAAQDVWNHLRKITA